MLNTTIAAMLGTPEIIIIAVVVLLLFGGKKIPELMRGLGKGVKEFKDGKDGVDGEQADPSNRDKTV
ncbi:MULTISPECIES: Sec-independent protein translocase subunit TatA/TatB [unclassified Pedobacter]|uniref:Sec-independent protein translocase subunit TatA/TatB n=1 Tax=Pedobacter TaxID=84567 RepID=UPI001C0F20AE|nr:MULTISPECIES: twin-arginine translocase TatA/TatE family subunit [unclassified Pedobacter]MCX2433184.1 twin-arginine translocase TatA/TatE family subunit [Pedobacter sp. GR22-10]MCX2586186.1 twin-arginine translocase TatA/TatE family subunit [Pedobacter sp. MR22-3]